MPKPKNKLTKRKPRIVDMTSPKAEVDAKEEAFRKFRADCKRMQDACDGLERMARLGI